jgi:hypothetical protein
MIGQVRHAAVLAAAALAATALTGCYAQTDYGNNPSGVATSYFHQLYNRDFTGACQLFTDQLRSSLAGCPGALSRALDQLPVHEQTELRDRPVGPSPRPSRPFALRWFPISKWAACG